MVFAPKVSVLLTTFNGARFLRLQVESILAQTLSEIELIAVDDGSNDETVDILSDYCRRDARVTVRADGQNLGQRARLAEALRSSSAPYIAISDQDDVWDPLKLEILALHLDGGAMLAFGPSKLIDAEGRDLGTTILDAIGAGYRSECTLAALFRPVVSAHASLVKRKGVSERSLVHEVAPFDWLMALDALYSDGLVYDPQAIVHHRMHASNQMNGFAASGRHQAEAQGRLRPWKIRSGLRRIQGDRIRFLARVEHLANSEVVPASVSKVFRAIYWDCWNTWFLPWRPYRGGAKILDSKVRTSLAAFSTDASDIAFFYKRFHQLQYTPPHPQAMLTFIDRCTTAGYYQE